MRNGSNHNTRNRTINKKVSYYDKHKGLKYILDKKSINKIRCKTLRNFCLFYQVLRTSQVTDLLSGKDIDKDTLINFLGAEKSFIKAQLLQLQNNGLDKDILQSVNPYISKRSLYDYMNTLKFIRAVDKSNNELTNHIFYGGFLSSPDKKQEGLKNDS